MPDPPVGKVPVKGVGNEPEHMVWLLPMRLLPKVGNTVRFIELLLRTGHGPEEIFRR